MRDEALLDDRLMEETWQIEGAILDQLRSDGRYAELAGKAEDKRHYFETSGTPEMGPKELPLSPPALRAWHFERKGHQSMPDDIDDYIRRIGFSTLESFDRALRREYLYVIGKRR